MKVLSSMNKDYDMRDAVAGIVFDTTSSITGIKKGALIRIAEDLNKPLLNLACRHHVSELGITHFCKEVTKEKTIGPDNPLFKKVKDQFEKPDFRYDPENLLKFDWKVSKGTIYTGNCCKQCYQSVERLPEF